MMEEETTFKVTDVPGGSVSFIFERGAKSALENSDEDLLADEDI